MRRSTRHKAEAPAPENKSSRKRAKKTAEPVNGSTSSNTKPQRRRGKLRFITEVPLDVLFEIFGQLLPIDLLNLSCASKALRDILLRKSAAFVWKQTFLNVPHPAPPPCPDDLNEPQYANLLWRKQCFFCGVSTPLVLWHSQVRACEACVDSPAKFTPLNSYTSAGPQDALEIAKTLCSRTWYCPRSRLIGTFVCLTSHLMAIQKRLEELGKINPDTQQFETNADTEEYARQCRETAATKASHSALCYNWEDRVKTNRRTELKNKGESRKNAILAKLEELGWGTELSNHSTRNKLLALPVVKQKKELTERVWANIEPDLVEFLTEVKRQRLDQAWIDVLVDRIKILTGAASDGGLDAIPLSDQPSISDLCIMPEYRAVLERPATERTTHQDFADALAHLSEQTNQWRKSNIDVLLQLLPSGSKKQGKKRLDTSILDLCTTFFRCHSCREPISYPRILNHACLKNPRILEEPQDEEKEREDTLLRTLPEAPWVYGCKGIVFDTEASNIAAMLITLCGQDPETLSTTAMDEVDSRFECLRCVHPTKGKLVMTWRIALLHELEEHYEEPLKVTSYRLLDPDEIIAAKEGESKSKKQSPPSFLCPKCKWTRNTSAKSDIERHIKWYHGEKSFEPVLSPDVTFRIPPYAVKLKI
ncbi:hypothetical protein MSAN_01029300 [Mycena sanguinolenta]|uniref:F-box domain-containing protein n=1 Tax=Mycena sanguinolenta TaxID=230812 RepID=A0A8H7D701_9AGAR|nr:hypothetical protein MSAN_01029300 [Mycena sanguinolenta]